MQPVLLDVLLPAAGSATASFVVPADPSLGGLVLRAQTIAVELDAVGNLLRLTSSNALVLTIGAL